ncbi:MAG: response regulator [Calditrichia bacterium]
MIIDPAQILVIDDEPGMREGLKRLLGRQGHEVTVAERGKTGVELGTAREYDLYFIDLKMPDMEGTTVLKEIKAKYPEAICVIMTAFASIETAVETTRLGAYSYMPKPFTPDELARLTNRALERRWYILEARRLKEEQERRLLEIAHEKSRMHTVINAIDDGLLVVNQQGEVALFNPRFVQLLELSDAPVIGAPVAPVLPEKMARQIQEVLANPSTSKTVQQEITIRPPAEKVLMVNTTPITSENGVRLGVVSVFRDISKLKQLELVKSQFVNMVAHELRAPLGAILGYLDMVVNKTLGDEPETYQKYLERSLERAESLLELINDLLNISRMEAGKARREIEKVNLSEILQEQVEFYLSEAQKRGLEVKTEIAPQLFVDVDKDELGRVFQNLISNAIKYNRENGQIFVRAKANDGYIQFEIEDTGIGMTPEERERLFEEFFRAKNRHTRKITGTGLGLSLVKKIIDSYAGSVEVQSEYLKGSCFKVKLPKSRKK